MKKILFLLCLISIITISTGCSNNDKNANKEDPKSSNFESIDTEKLNDFLDSKDAIVVDTRLNDAFNGWKLDNISRGGHIKGATDFSANWIKIEAKNKLLKSTLKDKGISKNKDVILYDTNGKDSKVVANYLKENGYKNIYLYDLNDWIKDDSKKLVSYPNYEKIVPATIVNDIIKGKKTESFDNPSKVKIVEVSWGEEKESYSKGHVPTAFHINTDAIEPPPNWMLDNDKNLKKFALKNGFKSDDTVIVTGDNQMAAYRIAVVLRYIGLKDVRVLNGGNEAWTSAGYNLDKESIKPTAVKDFGSDIPGDKELIITTDEVKEQLKDKENYQLVDNRSWDEYIGKSSGYSYHKKKGRIPGAIFAYAGKDGSSSLDYYTNPDGTMRNGDEILELFKTVGVDINKNLSFMCGSGWRAAETLTYAQVLGLDNTNLYSDGWIGWSNGNNPKETGDEGLNYVPKNK